MQTLVMAISALVLLTLAGYVHMNIPRYTRTRRRILITRLLLIVVGIGFGWISMNRYDTQPMQWLAFLTGFGLVHFPSAVILFIKSRRGVGKS